jgi:hypothetical protein
VYGLIFKIPTRDPNLDHVAHTHAIEAAHMVNIQSWPLVPWSQWSHSYVSKWQHDDNMTLVVTYLMAPSFGHKGIRGGGKNTKEMTHQVTNSPFKLDSSLPLFVTT